MGVSRPGSRATAGAAAMPMFGDDWDGPDEPIRVEEADEGAGPRVGPDDAGKDELNLAEFPIAALTDRVPDGQTTLVFEDRLEQREGPADRPPADDHGDAQARPAHLAGRRGPGRPDPAHQAAEQLHRRPGRASRGTS